jgi:hypothetical protein
MWQNAYSQLLYPEIYATHKKEEYIPPYNPNVVIISPDVKKWIDEQLAKESEKRTVEMKTDVLGRAKNSGKTVQSTKETEIVQITEPKQKRLVRISEMHFPQIEMEPMHGRYEYKPETKEHSYYLNGKKVSIKEYEILMKKHNEKIDSQKKGKRKLPIPGVINEDELGWTALITAEEISMLMNSYKEFAIDDYRKIEDGAATTDINSILSTIQLSTLGHNNGYDGDGVGIYMAESGCSVPIPKLVNQGKYTSHCSGSISTHANRVINVLQKAAPGAHVFGFLAYGGNSSANTHPSNPRSDYNPPIEIGNHSYMECLKEVTAAEASKYKYVDMEMDRYIYENRMINFVCAGNKQDTCTCPKCDTTSYVASPGKALNAITVGAVHSSNGLYPNRYTSYSQWKSSKVGNRKPEIAMYTDINLGSNYGGDFKGCSAATPLAAGFLASILEQHPFCKEQPAMMKASLMISEKIPILNADSIGTVAKGIVNYSTIAWGTGGAWWRGGNDAFFKNETIIHIENNVIANKRHVIAIAWLTEPSYTYSNQKISQDLDLYIYQNGLFLGGSESHNDPFEIASVVPFSNAPLEIVIRRYRNGDGNGANNGGNVFLGYNINYNH